uniref:CFAP65 seventh Ig-like domain-containing protein n=1 Tax=Eutreptiella gymnastica TaxID=73025 RepID=A0A7S1I2Z9_9EUGL|mmetsp:Transcript_124892/g.216488  ORF Transcript_124892/g.216488 Transcript_124892/m.216488 type:complete len:1754 (+) Transcript_124892:96-5357(+)
MEREDPPLMGNIRNIYQRFFTDLYRPPTPPRVETPPLDPEELERLAEEERQREEEKKKAAKGGKKEDKKKAGSAAPTPTPDTAPPTPAAPTPPPVLRDSRFDPQLESLEAGITASMERNAAALEALQERRQSLFVVGRAQEYNAAEAEEYTEQLSPACIDITRIIHVHDQEYQTTYKMPSQLEPPQEKDLVEMDRLKLEKSMVSTRRRTASMTASMTVGSSLGDSKVKGPRKPKQKPVEDPAMVHAERASMIRMNAIANHLVNPRYTAPGARSMVQGPLRSNCEATSIEHLKYVKPPPACPLRLTQLADGSRQEGPALLCAEPGSMHFSGYKPGGTYEQTLMVRNISGVARRCKVIPPQSAFFSVSLDRPVVGLKQWESPYLKLSPQGLLLRGGYQPDETAPQGLIAPGMAVSYIVRFSPDAPRNYTDRLMVCSEWNSFDVPLSATQQPPMLSLPPTIACGYCMAQGSTKQTLKVMNSGGDSGFHFAEPGQPFPTDQDPCITLGFFTVKPKHFSLRNGQCQDVTVVFSPGAEEKYHEELQLYCDNGDVLTYSIEGEGIDAYVVLAAIDDNPCNTEPDFAANNTLMGFDDLSIGGSATKSLTYFNPTEIPVRFHWRVEVVDEDSGQAPPESGVFVVTPDQGTLQPKSQIRFMVDFNPPTPVRYQAKMQLVLGGMKAQVKVKQPFGTQSPTLDQTVDATGFFASGVFSNAADQAFEQQVAAASVVEAFGTGKLLNVSLHPAVVADTAAPYVAGAALLSQRQIHVKNDSDCSAWFCFDPTAEERQALLTGSDADLRRMGELRALQTEDESITRERGVRIMFYPRMACINPHSTSVVTMHYAFVQTGHVELTLDCAVQRTPDPLRVRLVGNVTGATLRTEPEVVDFGIVQGIEEAESRLTLFNDTEVPLSYTLVSQTDVDRREAWVLAKKAQHEARLKQISKFAANSAAGKPTKRVEEQTVGEFQPWFTFFPPAGKLMPHENVVVSVFYLPEAVTSLRERLEVRVPGSRTQYVEMRAEVQTPKACIYPPTVEVEEAFLEVKVQRTVTLQNLTSIPTAFQWAILDENGAATTTFHPAQGCLEAGEKKQVEISIKPHRPGPFRLLVPCCLAGVSDPIACAITCPDVQAPHMSFTVTKDCPPLDVGMEAEDGQTVADYVSHLLHNVVNAVVEDPRVEYLPVVDFGRIPLGTVGERFVTIRNHSGSQISFLCAAAKYQAGEDYAHLVAQASVVHANKPGLILGNVHEKVNTFASKGGTGFLQSRTNEQQRQRLTQLAVGQAGDQGLAFALEQAPTAPYCIAPKGLLVLPLRCMSTIPGLYEDELVVPAIPEKGLPEARLPVRVEVVGPVLQLTKATVGLTANGSQGRLQFPPFVLADAAAPAQKKLHVVNISPQPLDVAWTGEGEGQGHFDVQPCTATIACGATTTFTCSFCPAPGAGPGRTACVFRCASPVGEPLTLAMEASTIIPSLNPDPKALKFKECPVTSGRIQKTIRLTNAQATPLHFTVALDGPPGAAMEVVSVARVACQADPDATAPKDPLKLNATYTIASRAALDVVVGFTPIECSAFVEQGPGDNTHVRNVVTHMVLDFGGGQKQRISVEAHVHFPILTVDKKHPLVFAPQGNDAAWAKTVELINPSIVPATFELQYVPNFKPVSTQTLAPPAAKPGDRLQKAVAAQLPIDAEAAFRISPMRGVVPGKAKHEAGRLALRVEFTPPSAAPFCSVYRVDVQHGVGCEFELKGNRPLQEHSDIMGQGLPQKGKW